MPIDTQPADTIEIVPENSFTVHFLVRDESADANREIGRLDVFAYDADGEGALLDHRRYSGQPDSVVLHCRAAAALIVAIANSPRDFNEGALDRYASMELLRYNIYEDSPESPLMSGQTALAAGGSGSMILMPLMCRVRLGEVSNYLKGYVTLENPRIYLESMNAEAEILRVSGFRPTESVTSTEQARLPYDIGIFPQTPGTAVYCYPNDDPAGVGTPATVLVFECEISGVTRRFRTTLPAIARGSTTTVDISVTSAETFENKVY